MTLLCLARVPWGGMVRTCQSPAWCYCFAAPWLEAPTRRPHHHPLHITQTSLIVAVVRIWGRSFDFLLLFFPNLNAKLVSMCTCYIDHGSDAHGSMLPHGGSGGSSHYLIATHWPTLLLQGGSAHLELFLFVLKHSSESKNSL